MPLPELDLDAAFADVMAEARRDDVPDVIRYADFGDAWNDVRAELRASVQGGTYQPLPATIVEVPKSRLATRPIAVLKLRDRIRYQAIMRELAPHIDSYLSEEVRSSRLVRTRSQRLTIAKQPKAWAAFQRRGRELCEEYSEACLLTTDITSYFEFIDVDRLSADLNNVPGVSTGPDPV